MPRKPLKPRERRQNVSPDVKYKSPLVGKLINKLNFQGKKSTAEWILYRAFDIVQEKTKEEPLTVFLRAMDNVRPLVEVKPRRVGGATYQVPVEVRQDRGTTLALRWLLQYSRDKVGKPMEERLAQEILDAARKEGLAIKKREDTHKMADANRAFAHYRW